MHSRLVLAVLVRACSAFAAEPPLKLELVSIRDARTSTPSNFLGSKSVSEWTVITAKASSRAEFGGGDATQLVFFVGEEPCLPVWRELTVSCIAPRISAVEARNLWGPVEVPISTHPLPLEVRRNLRIRAEKEGRAVKLLGVTRRPTEGLADINELIQKLRAGDL